MTSQKHPNVGKRILFGLVIFMSSIVILASAAGIVGMWLAEQALSDTAVTILGVVENSAGIVRESTQRVDQALAALEAKTTEIMGAVGQLGQNVADQGLIMVLLPEEKELEISETASSVAETFNTIRDTITKGLDLYRTINALPFVDLPVLSDDQVDELQNSLARTQALAETLRSQIAEFRTGAAGTIGKVEESAGRLNNEIVQSRKNLAQLDTRLADLEALAIRLQQVIPALFVTLAIILSFIFAFVIFTQVQIIRLYADRWRLLSQSPGADSPELPPEPVQQ